LGKRSEADLRMRCAIFQAARDISESTYALRGRVWPMRTANLATVHTIRRETRFRWRAPPRHRHWNSTARSPQRMHRWDTP
jgi:hypothetical protein